MQQFAEQLRDKERTCAVVVADLVYTLLVAGSVIEARDVFTVLIGLSPQARQAPTLPLDMEIELKSLCASILHKNQ